MRVIDGGISPELSDWVIDRWDLLDAADVDHAHGTFIGGLAVAGGMLNGNEICAEPDGIEMHDARSLSQLRTAAGLGKPIRHELLVEYFAPPAHPRRAAKSPRAHWSASVSVHAAVADDKLSRQASVVISIDLVLDSPPGG